MKHPLLQSIGVTILSYILITVAFGHLAVYRFELNSQLIEYGAIWVLTLLVTAIFLLFKIYFELKKPK